MNPLDNQEWLDSVADHYAAITQIETEQARDEAEERAHDVTLSARDEMGSRKLKSRRLNLYWTPNHERALRIIYRQMKRDGIPCEYGGKPNISAIIEYALEQLARQPKRQSRR